MIINSLALNSLAYLPNQSCFCQVNLLQVLHLTDSKTEPLHLQPIEGIASESVGFPPRLALLYHQNFERACAWHGSIFLMSSILIAENDAHHEKTDLKLFVIVIPRIYEGSRVIFYSHILPSVSYPKKDWRVDNAKDLKFCFLVSR